MSVIGGQNPVVQDGLVYILDFGNIRSYTSGSNSAKSLIYNPVTASFIAPPAGDYSGLAAAYSVRRVVSSYSGPAMEVQSGSVSASIGFDSFGNLDTGSLLAFAGSGDAFVKTWYDQSGNGNHVTQATAADQPKIYSGSQGSATLKNGRPCLDFGTTAQSLNLQLSTDDFGGFSLDIFNVMSIRNYDSSGTIYFGSTDVGYWQDATGIGYIQSNNIGSTPLINDGVLRLINDFRSGTLTRRINTVNYGTSTSNPTVATGLRTYEIGKWEGGTSWDLDGTISELLFFTTNQDSNRLFIESNINSYYNIYTSSFSPTPGFDTNKIDLSRTVAVDTNRTFPGFSYNQGNLTLIFTGETKTNTPLFTQANQMSVVGTTSSISYGLPNNTIGRTFPASGFDHISLRFTTGSVDCFVNGIPTAPNSIFPTGSFGTGDFIASNYSGSLGNLMVYNRPLSDDEIYSIYLQQARRYSLPETPKPYTVDSSVYVYSQAAGITDTVTLNALNTFVQGLKSASLWDKMVAIYPFIGVNSSGSRLNLKDVSLNTTQVNYSGSWSTSLSGSRNNNTASYGILSNVRGTYVHPLINSQSIHLSYLSYDTPTSGGYLMGVEQIPGLPGDITQPAAAYSVRKVRTAYTGSAMTVRRDSDDVTFDVGFDGNGNLNTGSLLTNMTASGLTTTLPGDYSGLAAAYSLRRVSSSYSGYAVEVRRAVDNYSASIGFDASGNLNTASLASFIRTGSETPISTYSGLAAAYSLRRVVPGYAGAAIEVQSGSVSQSIGFNSFGDLDVTAIRTFAGSGDAFVKTWFDQSGNSRHATQSVAASQPKIYSGSQGSVVLENGKPALEFDGINDNLSTLDSISFTNYITFFIAFKSNTTGRNILNILNPTSIFIGHGQGTANRLELWNENAQGWKSTTNSITGLYNLGYININSSGYQISSNNTLVSGAGSTPMLVNTNSLLIGARGDTGLGGYMNGTFQEILIYASDQSSNRTFIENNINSYYGIYTPSSVSTENAFVKTWYDQSGNNRHATQSVDANQPQIVSSGVIVTDGNRPAVRFDGTDDYFTFSNINTDVDYIGFQVVKKDTTNTLSIPVAGTVIGDSYLAWNYSDNSLSMRSARGQLTGATLSTTTKQLFTSLNIQTGNNTIWANGSLAITGLPNTLGGTGVINSIGRRTAGEYGLGTTQEIIIYQSNITSSRGLIEDNINGYYNIFTQSLASGSGYVTRWYDQSGNNNHATQSVVANQPLILSSGSIITDNGKPSLNFNGKILTSSFPYTNGVRYTSFQAIKQLAGAVLGATTNTGGAFYAVSDTLGSNSFSGFSTVSYFKNGNSISGVLRSSLYNVLLNEEVILTSFITNTSTANLTIGYPGYSNYNLKEKIIYSSDQSSSRQPIEQNINSYFNIYTPLAYNLNTNSLSLFGSPTLVAGGANGVATQITSSGPLGLITVSRTGSSNFTLFKNTISSSIDSVATSSLTGELYLNTANVNNTLFSSSQNTVAYASVGAGLTNSEVITLNNLVGSLQLNLRRVTDADAYAFLAAANVTGIAEQIAINTLVTDLKSYGVWTKMKALYPMVGGTANSHKFNLKDPRDTDSAFRLTFSGSWVHSSTGAQPNGAAGTYADTKLNLNTHLVPTSAHYMGYARTDNSGERFLMGIYRGASDDTFLDFYGSLRLFYGLASAAADISIPSWKGLWHLNALGSSTVLYRNGTSLNTTTRNGTLPSQNLFLGAGNNGSGGSNYNSIQELAFASIGDGLTDTEATNLYTAVQRFQTILNRQV